MGDIVSGFLTIGVMIGAVVVVFRVLGGVSARRSKGRSPVGGGSLLRAVVQGLPGIPLGVACASISALVIESALDWDDLGTVVVGVLVITMFGGLVAGRVEWIGGPVIATLAFLIGLFNAYRDLEGYGAARWWMTVALVAMFVGVLAFFLIPPHREDQGFVIAFAWSEVVAHLFVTGRVTELVGSTVGRLWLVVAVLWISGIVGMVFRVAIILRSFQDTALTLLGIGMLVLSSQRVWYARTEEPVVWWIVGMILAFAFAVPYMTVKRTRLLRWLR